MLAAASMTHTMLAAASVTRLYTPTMMAGFGAPPPAPKSLEEVVRGFGKSRLPKDFSEPCACGLGVAYASCCRPYHSCDKKPETPEWCLRSRYAAFAYRLPIYIIDTTDKKNPNFMKDKIKWARKLDKTSMFDTFDFSASSLGVGSCSPCKDDGTVEMENSFTLQPKGSGKPPITTYERTTFVKRNGGWLFLDGAVTSDAAGLKKRDAMRTDKDVEKLERDVEYAKGLVNKMQKK